MEDINKTSKTLQNIYRVKQNTFSRMCSASPEHILQKWNLLNNFLIHQFFLSNFVICEESCTTKLAEYDFCLWQRISICAYFILLRRTWQSGYILSRPFFFLTCTTREVLTMPPRVHFLITLLVFNASISFATSSSRVTGTILAAQNLSEASGINLTEACTLFIISRNYSVLQLRVEKISGLSRSQHSRPYLQLPLIILKEQKNHQPPCFTIRQASPMHSIWCSSYGLYEVCYHVIVMLIPFAIMAEIILQGAPISCIMPITCLLNETDSNGEFSDV